jgi:hypothetical protein
MCSQNAFPASMSIIVPPLVFTYQDGELPRFRREAWRTYARDTDSFSLWSLVVSMIFAIGLAVAGAHAAGLITTEAVPPVLLAAFAAYGGGVATMVLISLIHRRQLERAATLGQLETERRIAVSDTGIVTTSVNYDMRVNWQAVKRVDVRPDVVLIWLEWYQFIAVPMRVFVDETAGIAFIVAIREWIRAAHDKKQPG